MTLLHRIALAIALFGWGLSHAQDIRQEGRTLFNKTAVPQCALCHALKDAGATADLGPSLDELKPNAQQIIAAVKNGKGIMPANTGLSDAQLDVLVKYLTAVAGQ